jgi:NADP-dependent 3-hydroxy acid dehydrogenase YdfG
MSSSRQSQTAAVVTGAGRGFGSAIAADALADVHRRLGAAFVPVVADATDAETSRTLIGQHQPTLLVLNAGATPVIGPVHEQSWESFSRNRPGSTPNTGLCQGTDNQDEHREYQFSHGLHAMA